MDGDVGDVDVAEDDIWRRGLTPFLEKGHAVLLFSLINRTTGQAKVEARFPGVEWLIRASHGIRLWGAILFPDKIGCAAARRDLLALNAKITCVMVRFEGCVPAADEQHGVFVPKGMTKSCLQTRDAPWESIVGVSYGPCVGADMLSDILWFPDDVSARAASAAAKASRMVVRDLGTCAPRPLLTVERRKFVGEDGMWPEVNDDFMAAMAATRVDPRAMNDIHHFVACSLTAKQSDLVVRWPSSAIAVVEVTIHFSDPPIRAFRV